MKFAIVCDQRQDSRYTNLIEEMAEKRGMDVFYLTRSGDDPTWQSFLSLFLELRRLNPDFVFGFNSYSPYYLLPLFSRLLGFGLVYSPHCLGCHKLQPGWKNWLKRTVSYPFMKGTWIRAISIWEKKQYEEAGFNTQRIFRIPIGIDVDEFGSVTPNWGGKEIFSLANVRKFKEVQTQIEAIAKLTQDHPEARLHMIGGWEDEEYREEINKLIEELEVSDNIIIHGYVERREIADIISRSEAFIHTSKFETQGLAIYEAATAGFPICVSDVPVHNQNFERFKHPQGDAEALAEDIESIFEMDNVEKEKISEEMSELASDFSYEKERERLNKLFDELKDNG